MIEPVCIREHSGEITRLLRESHRDVAEQFGLTGENCPSHVAFLTEERLLDQLDREDAHSFGIREGDRWVGFVALAPYRDAYEITRLSVLPGYRHKGYGRALMDRACEKAKEIGLESVGLGMIDENTVLKNWYIQQGFIQEEPFRLPHLPFTVCPMGKTL